MSRVDGLTSGISGTIPQAPTAPVRNPKATLDQADFLRLLTAQLQNQDPTKPVDNLEYVQQMAMFSQIAGTTDTNSKLDGIASRLDQLIARFPAPTQEQ
jgi:flagellar basal-body rod modification protein FlgD